MVQPISGSSHVSKYADRKAEGGFSRNARLYSEPSGGANSTLITTFFLASFVPNKPDASSLFMASSLRGVLFKNDRKKSFAYVKIRQQKRAVLIGYAGRVVRDPMRAIILRFQAERAV